MTEERNGDRAPRRRLLKRLAAGGSAASLAALPGKWAKPVVASVILPAHAQTSPGCVGTLDNCPSGHLYSDSGATPGTKYFDPSIVSAYFPAISSPTGSFTGSDTFQKYERNGPCPSPCGNADESKYVSATLGFSDNTVSIAGDLELRCGGDAVQDISFQFTGSFTTVIGDDRVYSGSGSYTVEACKYLFDRGRAPSGGTGAQILRRFRFGG